MTQKYKTTVSFSVLYGFARFSFTNRRIEKKYFPIRSSKEAPSMFYKIQSFHCYFSIKVFVNFILKNPFLRQMCHILITWLNVSNFKNSQKISEKNTLKNLVTYISEYKNIWMLINICWRYTLNQHKSNGYHTSHGNRYYLLLKNWATITGLSLNYSSTVTNLNIVA